MPLTWTTNTTRELAGAAAEQWNASVERHIANSGNSVWLMRRNGEDVILRLSDPVYRSRAECEAEIDYLEHLSRCGVQVGRAILSKENAHVERIKSEEEEMLASAFTYAPGEYVDSTSPHWNDRLFLEWGKTLGKIHAASKTFHPTNPEGRWLWRDELFLAHAPQLIPPDDTLSLREFDLLTDWFDRLPQSDQTFGMTHGDFAPQNFNFHPEIGITAFDFGNCCYHWYLSDIVVSLTVLRRYEEGERYRELLIEGYREHGEIDPDLWENRSWFFRLRALYVYLSRLMKFGPNPTDQEREILLRFQRNVHHPSAW